jgi:alkaline phosphatase
MVAKFKQSGYTYVSNEEELNNVKDAAKLLGLFSPEYMNYKTDRDDVNSKEPSLKEMTSTALDILSKDKDGFFMMSEGARIDHAAHAGDATGVWKETIEFDETVKFVLDWAKLHPDTLVVVTADHQTMAIAPSEAIKIDALKNNVTASPEYMGLQMVKNAEGTQFTVDSIKSIIKKYSAIELTDDETLALQKKLDVKYGGYKLGYEIGSVIAKKYGVAAMDGDLRAFGKTGGHTSAWVPLFAEGRGAEKFHGVIDNTDIIKIIMDIVK